VVCLFIESTSWVCLCRYSHSTGKVLFFLYPLDFIG